MRRALYTWPFIVSRFVHRGHAMRGRQPTPGSGPRTRLSFLRDVVRKAAVLPNTACTAQPYKLYPVFKPGDTTRRGESSVLYKDDSCVLINDAYPKSTVHCLVLPLDISLASLNDLTAKDVPLLRHLVSVADGYTRFLYQTKTSPLGRLRCITGFHALPSLPMLHMHLLSMDLDSPCLKTKKHYNSFATFFFLTSDRVIEDLEKHGRVTINQDVATLSRMEEQAMKCLWCGASLTNMPTMREHIRECPMNQSQLQPPAGSSAQPKSA